jgi:hypothetical protein
VNSSLDSKDYSSNEGRRMVSSTKTSTSPEEKVSILSWDLKTQSL